MDWQKTLTACGVKQSTAARWAPVFAVADLPSAGLADFLGQVLHESAMLERLEEGLSYTAERLCSVWPKRFPTTADAAPFARSPEALANKVYGGRMGNTQPGDGYRYRGRGLLQVTGRDNYAQAQRDTGLPLLDDPDRVAQPAGALAASVAWWRRNVPATALGDIGAVTKIVNGGFHGLAERQQLTARARSALKD